MRWHIVRTLLQKEVLRQTANRGGIALALLLIVAALMMTFFAKEGGQAGVLTGGVETCFIDYWQEDDWVKHLRDNVPADLQRQVKFRHIDQALTVNDNFCYPPGTGAIQMRTHKTEDGQTITKVWPWDPNSDGSGLAPYELWFWLNRPAIFSTRRDRFSGKTTG